MRSISMLNEKKKKLFMDRHPFTNNTIVAVVHVTRAPHVPF